MRSDVLMKLFVAPLSMRILKVRLESLFSFTYIIKVSSSIVRRVLRDLLCVFARFGLSLCIRLKVASLSEASPVSAVPTQFIVSS